MDNVAVIIPSFNPDDKLNMVVDGLLKAGFTDIVLVNDGSDESHAAPFEEAGRKPGVTVLTHECNRGKGRALKTAFAYLAENREQLAGVVTADGDNQHKPEDVAACAEKMTADGKVVLGSRDFSVPEIPLRSKFGNVFTSVVFRLFCGIRLSDTQTGLRAIPAKYLSLLCETEGERYEYETEMLFAFRKNRIKFEEIKIRTVYLENNASTHFDPIRDSLKIYKIIFKFMLSSVASFLIDYGLFSLLAFVLAGHMGRGARLFAATFLARVFSSLFNYFMNRQAVFRSKATVKSSLIRYYALCAVQTGVSYGAVYLLSSLFAAQPLLEMLFKLVVDMVLFLLSFQIQQRWVFAAEDEDLREKGTRR